MPLRPLLLVLIPAAVLASACSSDSKLELTDYATAIANGIQSDDQADSIETSDAEARCVAEAAVDTIGLDALVEAGTPDEVEKLTTDDLSAFDLSEGASLDIANAFLDCVPSTLDQFLGAVAEDDATRTCLEGELSADDIRLPLAASVRGDEPSDTDLAAISAALEACATSDADRQAYVDALAASVLSSDGSSLGMTSAEATCFADNAITVVGQERTLALGDPDAFVAATADDLTALGLSDDELTAVARGYFDCSATAAAAFREQFMTSTGLQGDQAACVNEIITDDVLIDIIGISLGGGDPTTGVLGTLEDELTACS